ncbi:hypothetical protein GF339_15280, partial [candidate division KSB3 bacterium]|nr:hypothetical protein [candidate division KSB3 bacterium]MBD3325948.1 hypothetical protein [candidate division KSB3 bacterium]
MRIKQKLHINTVLFLAMMVIIGATLFMTFDTLNQASQKVHITNELIRGVFELNIVATDFMFYQEERPQTQWNARYTTLEQILATPSFQRPDERDLFLRIHEYFEDVGTLFARLRTFHDLPLSERTAPFHTSLEERIISQLMVKAQEMVSLAFQLEQKTEADLITTQRTASLFIMGLIVVMG